MLLQSPDQKEKLPFDSDFTAEQDELARLPQSPSELARLRLNLAASAFELCRTLELDDHATTEVGQKLYNSASTKYNELDDIRIALDGITASTLDIDSPVWAEVQSPAERLHIVHERPHSLISPDIVERLRDGQEPVVESMLKYLSSRDSSEARGYVSAPTGSGKTVLFTTLLEVLRQNGELPRTYIAVPTKQLVDQTHKEMIDRGFGGEIRTLKAGIRKDDGGANVVIGTYNMLTTHTSFRSADRMWAIDPESYGLVVLDEAHHMHGGSTQNSLNGHFTHAAWLGFTATPDYDEQRQLNQVLPDEVAAISTPEAVDLKLIAPYITGILTTPGDLSHVNIIGKNYDPESLEKAINTEVRNHVIAKFAADMLKDKKIMFNTGTVAHGAALAEMLRSYGVKALNVYGGQSPKELRAILKAFHNGEVTALTQAKLLGEGYDETGIDVVMNVNPSLSYVRQKQRTGRGQRIDPKNPDKTLLVIECIDKRYQSKPVLYGHPEVTGHWTYAPDGVPQTMQETVARLESYEDNVSHFTTDPEVIEAWYSGDGDLVWGKTDTPAILPAYTPDAIELEDIMPEDDPLPQKTRTARQSTRPPEDYVPVYVPPKGRRQELVDQIWRERHDKLYIGDFEEVSSAAEVADKLSETERGLADFILNGSEVPAGVDKITTQSVLRQLAGTKELEDPAVLDRFRRLNMFVAGRNTVDVSESDPDATLHESIERTSGGRYYKKVLDIEGFRPDNGACYGADAKKFFPGRGESTKEAKAICASCPVQQDCLDYAIVNGEKFGIWGGASERERRRIRRRRRIVREMGQQATSYE